MDLQQSEQDQIKRTLEAALLSSPDPIPVSDLRRLFDADYGSALIRRLLEDLVSDWKERGVELVSVASGWRFQVRAGLQQQLDRLNPQRPPRYSRAVLETLAIIAYKQPVTRGDIENIRGVSVSSNILKTLEARGWIDIVGHRESPGRPALFATTRSFLDDLSLRSLDELPPLEELGTLVEDAGVEDVQGDGSIDAGDSSETKQTEQTDKEVSAEIKEGDEAGQDDGEVKIPVENSVYT